MDRLRKYIIAKCSRDEEQIRKAAEALVLNDTPHNFNPFDPDNVLKVMEEQFEQTCAAMEEMGVTDPKSFTEFEFYSRLKYYEKKQQHHARHKQI